LPGGVETASEVHVECPGFDDVPRVVGPETRIVPAGAERQCGGSAGAQVGPDEGARPPDPLGEWSNPVADEHVGHLVAATGAGIGDLYLHIEDGPVTEVVVGVGRAAQTVAEGDLGTRSRSRY
jgi:hypothetical protein